MSNAGTSDALAAGVGLSMLKEASSERRLEFVQAVMNRGVELFQRGQFDSADVVFQTMEQERSVRPLVLHMRGVIALHRGEDERALDLIEEAIRLNPADGEAHANLGILLLKSHQYAQALAAYAAALTLQPNSLLAQHGLARAFAALDLAEFAEQVFREVLAVAPDYVDALTDFAAMLNDTGRHDEAAVLVRDALTRHPESRQLHMTLAVALFRAGQWPEGWAEYEWRFSDPAFGKLLLGADLPRWRGEALDGKTILLQSEQGFGDTLQFVRYAPMVKARGGRVILRAPNALQPLMQTVAGIDEIISSEQDAPTFDVHAPLLSLPLIFPTGPDAVPADIPYVAPDPDLTARWRERLGDAEGISVGLVWHGNPSHANDRRRSIPLDRLQPLLDCPGARFVSLQVGPGEEQLVGLSGRVVDAGRRFDRTSFADVAAVIGDLDLVISVDSAVAHLAGAMGKPVWMLLATPSDWRWHDHGTDTAWYPQTRLFRQTQPGHWGSVIEQLRSALWSFAGADAEAAIAPAAEAATAVAQRPVVSLPSAERTVLRDALFVEACRQHRAGHVERSKQLFEHVLSLDPAHVNTLCNLGAVELKRGDGVRALKLLQTAVQLAPRLAPAWIALADARRGEKQNELALASYRKAIELDPKSAAAHVAYAKALHELGGLEPADRRDRDSEQTVRQHFRKALELAPNDDAVHAGYALVLHDIGDLDGAMTEFLAATRINRRQSAEFYQALGRTCAARGNSQGAEISLKHAIALDPHLASAHCALGDLYGTLARPVDAEASFRSALAIDATNAFALSGIERVQSSGGAAVLSGSS